MDFFGVGEINMDMIVGDMKMIKKIKIRLLHWLLDDYIDDILTHYTSEVIKPCIKNHYFHL